MPGNPTSGNVRDFTLFCIRAQHADALSWMVLRRDIKVLVLEKCNLYTDDFLWLLKWADHLPFPIRLELKKNKIGMANDDVADAIAQNRNLIALDVRKNRFPRSSMSGLFEKLKANTTLRCLGIDLLERDMNALAQYLQENGRLDTLFLQNAERAKDPPLKIEDALLANKTLKRVSLHDWAITKALSSGLFGPHETLASLSFERCCFLGSAFDGPDPASSLIASSNNLSTLRLRHCGIGSYGALVKALHTNTALVYLTLECTDRLDTNLFHAMQQMLQVNQTLLHFAHDVEILTPGDKDFDRPRNEAIMEIQRRLKLNNIRAQKNTIAMREACWPPSPRQSNEHVGDIDPDRQNSIGKLPRPPFPPDILIDAPEEDMEPAFKVAEQWMRNGMPEDVVDEDARLFAQFCVMNQCAHALSWLVLRHAMKTLSLADTGISDGDFLWLMTWMEQLPRPITLDISETEVDLTDTDVADAVAQSRTLNGLRALRMNAEHENTMADFLAVLMKNDSLTELHVGLSTAEDLGALGQYLQRNHILSSLHIEFTKNRDDDEQDQSDESELGSDIVSTSTLLPGLSANDSLTRIAIYDFHIAPGLIDVLFAPDKKLTTIQFETCTFTSDAVAALAEAITSHRTLSTLEVQECHFPQSEGSKPGDAILTALQFNRSITNFQFTDSETSINGNQLLSILNVNSTVSKLPQYSRYGSGSTMTVSQGFRRSAHFFKNGYTRTVKRRLYENRKAAKLAEHYPLAERAFSILPGGGLPALPMEVSQRIVRMLPSMGPSALSTYQTLHRLSVHRLIQAQARPYFPDHLDLSLNSIIQKVATEGRNILPMSSATLHHVARFCIRHQAQEVLDWLVVHTPLDELRLGPGLNTKEELRWLLTWMRSAPAFRLKLSLADISLSKGLVGVLVKGLRHHNTTLAGLSIKDCDIRYDHLISLLYALQFNDTLQELALPAEMAMPTYPEFRTVADVLEAILAENHTMIEIDLGQALSSSPPNGPEGSQHLGYISDLLKRNRLLRMQAQ